MVGVVWSGLVDQTAADLERLAVPRVELEGVVGVVRAGAGRGLAFAPLHRGMAVLWTDGNRGRCEWGVWIGRSGVGRYQRVWTGMDRNG